MAKIIKRTVNIEYQAKGLDKMQKELSAMKINGFDSETLKQFKKESQELASVLKNKGTATDPETHDIIAKKYEHILLLHRKLRGEIAERIDWESGANLQAQTEEMARSEALIEQERKKMAAIQKRIGLEKEDGPYFAKTKTEQARSLQEASKVLGPEDQMKSMKGRDLKSADRFVQDMSEVDVILDKILGKNSLINQKLKEGTNLTTEEINLLDNTLEVNKEKGALEDSFKLTAEDLNKQYQIRDTLLKSQQEVLEASYIDVVEPAKEIIETEEARLELSRQIVEEYNERLKSMEGSEELSEEEREQLAMTQTLNETNIDLLAELNKKKKESRDIQKENTERLKQHTSAQKENNTTLGRAAKQVFNYGTAFMFMKRIYQETLRTIKEIDSALTEMAVVTSMNRKEAWKLVPTLQNIAKETGFASTEIAKLSTVYFRQGRTLNEVIELTTVAAKAARIAGISAQESANYLTSAVNGFGLAAEQALEVSDKFAALAASSASSYEELATGLSKFAAQANIAGMSIDFALGMLAKGVETTREAPETIGTALKTVISRMRELTDLGKTFEDGMNVNRVETALRQVGVQLIDTNGQFRDMQAVLTDVGNAWETLNTNQRASVAVALAGTRQQSRLIAIMNDFDRTLELVDTSMYSQGATNAQHMEYMKSMEAATVNLQNAWQKFITTITNSEVIIGVVKLITGAIEGLAWFLDKTGFVGRNLFTTIVAIVAISKIWNVVTAIGIKLGLIQKGATVAQSIATGFLSTLTIKQIWAQGLLNATTTKSILLDKLKTAGLLKLFKSLAVGIVKWTAYWVASMGPIGWIIAGLAAITAGVYLLVTAQDRRIKKLKEERAELQKNIYETNKFTKELGALYDQIEKLNSKPIKIEADYEELNSLISEIEQIEEEKDISLVVRNEYTQEIDYTKTLKNLENYQKEQKEIVLSGMRSLVNNTIDLYREGEATIAEVGKSYSNLTVANYEDRNGRLEEEQRDFIESYSKIVAKSQRRELKNKKASDRELAILYEESNRQSLQALESFNKEYEKILNAGSISEQVKIFEEIIENIEDPKLIDAYKDTFSELDFVIENFGTNLDGIFDKVIQKIGLTGEAINSFNEKAAEAGYDPQKVIQAILNRTNELIAGEMTEENATAKAYAEIASVIEDATFATYLYGLASTKTILSTSQEVDRLNSVIENLSSTQEKFLSGEMSQSDLFQFIEDNADLFSDDENLNKFLNGENISTKAIELLGKEYQNYNDQLISINEELEKLENSEGEANQAKVESLKVQRAQVIIAMQYNGILRGLSETQYNYNNTMLAYKRASDLGVESDSLRLKMMEAIQNKTKETILETNNKIDQLQNDLNSNLEGSWNDYVDIVDGVAIINTEIYKDLDKTGKKFVDDFVNNFNSEQEALYESFKELRDTTLEEEKKAADKKKKIYEDYFAALDRLEAKRERSQSREDLVAQLQRLEGATDEKSRQKAKEIRKELNQLDKDAAKDAQEESRQAMIDSIDQGIIEVEEKFADIWEDFLNAGAGAGEALIEALKTEGFLDESGAIKLGNIIENNSNVDPTGGTGGTQSGVGEVEVTDEELLDEGPPKKEGFSETDWKDAFKNYVEKLWNYDYNFMPNNYQKWKELVVDAGYDPESLNSLKGEKFIEYASSPAQTTYISPKMPNKKEGKNFFKWWYEKGKKVAKGYSKGGIVDYTGSAMVHGSKTQPEAFLNAKQTELFANLRDMLQKVSIDSNSSSSFVIENITIQTQELNNNQDFKKAGRTLADEFASAIKSRGLNLNVKR